MHLPHFLRRINRDFTNPLMGTIAWLVPPLAIVHHVGRRTGKVYRAPVIAFRTARGFVIPMTYGTDVDWGRNLLAAGGGEVEQMGSRQRLYQPRIVGGRDAYPHLPPGVRELLRAADLPGYVLLDFEPPREKRPGRRRARR